MGNRSIHNGRKLLFLLSCFFSRLTAATVSVPQPLRSLLPLRAVSAAPCAPLPPHRAALPSLRYVGRPGLLGTRRPQRHPRRALRVTLAAKRQAASAPLRAGGGTNGGPTKNFVALADSRQSFAGS